MSQAGIEIHKLADFERPRCDCGRDMWLLNIKPADLGLELRDYECSRCGGSKTLLVQPSSKSQNAT